VAEIDKSAYLRNCLISLFPGTARFPRLRSLVLNHAGFGADDFLVFLRDVPSLQYVCFRGMTPELLRAVAAQHPALVVLDLSKK
jgi:hypothetical protein